MAGKMLDVARERFRDFPDQFRYVAADYRTLADAGSFDLVISSLSIHHLDDREKQELFRQIYGVLRQPGVFINIDLIKGPTPYLEEFYCSDWYEKMRRAGAPDEEIRAGIERRLAYDRDALMEDQLRWLREAGFSDADCVYRNYKMGLFLGMKRNDRNTNSRSRMISRRRGLRLRGVLKSTLSSRRRANAERALIWNWNNAENRPTDPRIP